MYAIRSYYGLYVVLTLILVIISTLLFKEFGPEFEPKHNGSLPPPPPNGKPEFLFHFKLIGPFIFNILLVVTGIALRVYAEWNRNERHKKEIEVQKSATELSFLKNQLNPHFLFNSLNSIYSLTTKKSNDAPEAVIRITSYNVCYTKLLRLVLCYHRYIQYLSLSWCHY